MSILRVVLYSTSKCGTARCAYCGAQVTELAANGSLLDQLRREGERKLPVATLCSYSTQIADGMKYLGAPLPLPLPLPFCPLLLLARDIRTLLALLYMRLACELAPASTEHVSK